MQQQFFKSFLNSKKTFTPRIFEIRHSPLFIPESLLIFCFLFSVLEINFNTHQLFFLHLLEAPKFLHTQSHLKLSKTKPVLKYKSWTPKNDVPCLLKKLRPVVTWTPLKANIQKLRGVLQTNNKKRYILNPSIVSSIWEFRFVIEIFFFNGRS